MSTPTPGIDGSQIKDGAVERHDMNTSVPGQAVVERLIAGAGITLSSTGADTGTGDVTISVTGAGQTGGNGTAAAPATASSLGTVETDITESGGSVVYTKTTLDSLMYTRTAVDALLAQKISVGTTLPESEIAGLLADLAGKLAAGTMLPESEITNLVADLAAKTGGGTPAGAFALTLQPWGVSFPQVGRNYGLEVDFSALGAFGSANLTPVLQEGGGGTLVISPNYNRWSSTRAAWTIYVPAPFTGDSYGSGSANMTATIYGFGWAGTAAQNPQPTWTGPTLIS